MAKKEVEYTDEKLSIGEEILGNLGFWPIVLAILALAASFLLKAHASVLLTSVFALFALAKAADAARYIIYRKQLQKGVRSLSACILLVGIAVCSPKIVEIFALWR